MHCLLFLFFVGLVSGGGPEGQEGGVAKTGEPDLPYTVKSYNYKKPQIAMSEVPASNNVVYYIMFPQYTLNLRRSCPYKLIEDKYMTKRVDDTDAFIDSAELTFWSKEHSRDIHLDTYQVIRQNLADSQCIDSITVYKAAEGNKHHVSLSMDDHTCRKMEYTVKPDFTVTSKATVTPCTEVERLNKENDEWIADRVKKSVEEAQAKEAEAKDPAKGVTS